MNANAKISGGTIQGDTFTNHPEVQQVFGNAATVAARRTRAERDKLVSNRTYHDRCRATLAAGIQQSITARLLCAFPDDHELAELAITGAVWRRCQMLGADVIAELVKLGALPAESKGGEA